MGVVVPVHCVDALDQLMDIPEAPLLAYDMPAIVPQVQYIHCYLRI
jgi:hypothetical protein